MKNKKIVLAISGSFKIMIFIMMFSLILASASAHPGLMNGWLGVGASFGKWVEKADTPSAGGYGEAVVSTNNSIYIARNLYATTNPLFWRYNTSINIWSSMSVSGLPLGAFRNGATLAWNNGSYIYALPGARYPPDDVNRRLFYRYSITNNNWEQLADTPQTQGAGDAITWSGYDGYIYAIMGSAQHGTAFARYKYNSWEVLPLNPNWTFTDDGASLAWTGGEYLYALRGEYAETVPNGDFARYHIPSQTWVDMKDIPEDEGVGDGASLLWVGEYSDDIFALGGGDVYENPGYNFYSYSISTNSWEQLESIPCPIGYYVGNRLGFANGSIYYWQGSPTTDKWICGGDAFYMFKQSGCTGDQNGDSKVNFNDFVMFAYAYNTHAGDANYNVLADLNSNGVVDFNDFTVFASVYGVICTP